MILAVDPGKFKSGLALLDHHANAVKKEVVASLDLIVKIKELLGGTKIETMVIGEGVFGRQLKNEISVQKNLPPVVMISEKDSSWQARQRYWREHPPHGWKRLIPTSLLVPPVPIDDYAALIIGERYLKNPVTT